MGQTIMTMTQCSVDLGATTGFLKVVLCPKVWLSEQVLRAQRLLRVSYAAAYSA